MIRGLINKELRQHSMALLFVLLLMVAGVGVILNNKFMHRAFGTPFAAVQYLLLSFIPLGALVLSQVLIVSEYRNKTQLFLEGLPLPRWLMIAIKYALGLVLMLASVMAVLFVAWRTSRGEDAVTPRFLLLLGLRSICYVWFMWSLCFAHGFMGRYRFLFAVVALALIKVDLVIHNIDLAAHGPFALVGDRFAYERYVLPTTQLLVTAGDALFWLAAGFLLGLARDANLAAVLAQRMSMREKIGLTFAIFALVLGLASQDQRHRNAAPINLPGAVEVARGPVHVAASAAVDHPTGHEEAALRQVAGHAADELAAVADYLHCSTMPPVFIVHHRDLKPGVIEDADIKMAQGLMLRVNLIAREFDEKKLLLRLIHDVLLVKSCGRLNLEKNAWVFEGFADWWRSRREPPGRDPVELDDALKALPPDFSVRDLERWLALHKRTGRNEAHALSSTGLRVLTMKHGDAACRRFLASVLGLEVPVDARAWLRDVLNPVPSRFHAATGMTLAAFVTEWRESLHEAAARPPKEPNP